ncbi:PREDICTED: zinc finger protein ZXDC-like isoform X2 [Amphimedon queenslandica]|uniref:C2H2-type domain-containing protein n=1 Tax=Amphimedon queenslandica TaxID=400682 RepID=A0AAN0J9K9_AMPQE|nr:PREDICTED: zinc finger protein ZXDC-like isoform X2 [Amphimedon queenslandica]|eukprot:XP_019853704.1 PREDICTED: zinc finger protein ZXDC-like isoform X2 [Amphimedon queenslandica]
MKPQSFQSLTDCSTINHIPYSSVPSVTEVEGNIRDCNTGMGRQTRHSKTNTAFTACTSRQTRSSNLTIASTTGSSSTVASDKVINLKPVKTDVVVPHRSSGGRHLQPPIGNDAKLKHKCPFDGCPWRFATPYKLRRHIKSHTKETPYQCKECGRGFSVRYNLLMHVQTIHSTPQKYSCPVRGCKDAFHTQPRLNGHLRKVHKTDIKQIQAERNDSEDSESSANAVFTCKECQKVFTTQAKLNVHARTHVAPIRPFKCSVEGCHKSFQTADKLEKHSQTHSSVKSWVCPYKDCKRVFLRQSYLKSHLKVHAKEQFICPIPGCEHKLSSELEYNDHVSLHMGYSLPCPQCSLVFPTPKRLELHMHVAHANECLPSGFHMSLIAPNTSVTPHTVPSSLPPVKDEPKAEKEPKSSNIHSLPYLKVEEVEAVIYNHKKDHILSSLSSFGEVVGTEYESDSGYSTFDVSPHGSHASTGFFSNALLSPAITPVTPTPGLPNSTSPVSFGFSDDGLLMNGTGHFFSGSAPHPPLSASSSSDGNYFFEPPTDALSDHAAFSFSSSSSQSKKEVNPLGLESKDSNVLQTVQKATRNVSSFEESKQTVVLVPNSFNPSSSATSNSNKTNEVAPAMSSVTLMTTPPPVKAEDSIVITIKPEVAYSESQSSDMPHKTQLGYTETAPMNTDTSSVASKLASNLSSKPSVPPTLIENGRLVYARVVPVSNGSLPSNKGTGKSSGSKSRHRISKKSKNGGGAHKSSQWPKSMNPGNLVAFRNFILKKLNKEQGGENGPGDEEEELGEELGDNRLLAENDFFPSFRCHESMIGSQGFIPDGDNFEEMFKDVDFNPDSLLSLSEMQETCSLSPFSVTGTSLSDPFSPSSSSSGGGFEMNPFDENMDFDGFFHMFDVTPAGTSSTSLSVAPPSSESELDLLSLSQDLDMIFKSDADPLLGGIS